MKSFLDHFAYWVYALELCLEWLNEFVFGVIHRGVVK